MKTNTKFLLFFSGLTASLVFLSYCDDLKEDQKAQWHAYQERSRVSTDKLVSALDNLSQNLGDLSQNLEKVGPIAEDPDCEE